MQQQTGGESGSSTMDMRPRTGPGFPFASSDRRAFLRHGATLASIASLFRLQEVAAGTDRPTADACILVFLNGGMSQIDSFDPKPDASAGIRGEFATIGTSAPGVHCTDQLPRMAQQAHRFAVIRTVGYAGRLGNHSPGCYHMLTGEEPLGDSAVLAPPRPTDQPSMGSVAAKFRPVAAELPPWVMVPDVLIENAFLTPGQFAGSLGARYEAFNVRSDPSRSDFTVPNLALPPGLSANRIAGRRALLTTVNRTRLDLADTRTGRNVTPHYQRAFDLLTTRRAQAAFRIADEPAADRQRYGSTTFGQSLLLSRRLVEAGVRFVNVHWPNVSGGRNWDTHRNGFNRLRNDLLPSLDLSLSALLEDLDDRGLLERTLVAVITEFGRAPYIGVTFQNNGSPGGRDHWSDCFSILMAGGGIRGGSVYGQSDRDGAYPAEKHVRPADTVATVYHAKGIDPHVTLPGPLGQPRQLCHGWPIKDLF